MAGLIWVSLCLFGLYAGPDQKLVNRIYTATSLVVVVIAGFFLTMKWARITNFNIVIYVLVGLVLLMFTAAGGSGVVGAAVRWLNKPRPEGFIVVPVSVLVLSFGLTLFYIRLRLRFFYGFTEVLAGIAVAANKVVTEAKSLTAISASWSLAMLTAGVYLVVRGLDNMHQGISKDPLDKVACGCNSSSRPLIDSRRE
jgi:hypothetical protein